MQIVYTCPVCGHDLQIQMLCSDPPQTAYHCYQCNWDYVQPGEQTMRIPFRPEEHRTDLVNKTPLACHSCSNNPQNGGSGICNCTLGNTMTWEVVTTY